MITAKYGWVFLFIALLIGGCMVAHKKKLDVYNKKRSLKSSGEPVGQMSKKTKKSDKKLFVIQKHAASHLHYDFRLEVDGVLVSWAVPKGPSTNPAEKHLAVMTEDHPLDYATFEGVIPAGNYGAGVVMVWDIGTYTNLKKEDKNSSTMQQCIDNGHVEVYLEGKVLRGAYALIRMHGDQPKNWLLVKMHDEYANKPKNPVKSVTKSALSDRTMLQLKKSGER